MDEIRIGNADRDAAIDRVRIAFGEGRLTEAELGERLEKIYDAQTRTDLLPAFQGLPSPAPPPVPVTERANGAMKVILPAISPFIFACVVCTLVWLLTGADGSFWPKWVYFGCGIAAFMTATGIATAKR